jgi:hypothetical protein
MRTQAKGAPCAGFCNCYVNLAGGLRLIPQAIVKGAIESQTDRHSSQEIAARILRPALASLRQDRPERWGLSENDVATVLRDAPAPVRRGALDILVRWMHADNAGAAEAWRIVVGPFFDKVWPKERRFVDEANNSALMDLAVGAGTRFRGPSYPETIHGALPREPRQFPWYHREPGSRAVSERFAVHDLAGGWALGRKESRSGGAPRSSCKPIPVLRLTGDFRHWSRRRCAFLRHRRPRDPACPPS